SLAGDISPDGKTVLFTEGGEGGGPSYSVYMRGMDDSPAIRLGDGGGLAFSPDGKWILSGDPHKIPVQLVLLPTGAGEPRQLTHESTSFRLAGWFPDGKSIVMTGSEKGHGPRVYAMRLGEEKPRALTPEGFAALNHPISPDGRQILVREVSTRKWSLLPVGGGEARIVPGTEDTDSPIQWAGDGKSLYVAQYGNPAKIFLLNIASGKRELWKVLTPSDPSGVAGIGPIHITPDGKSYVYSLYRDISDLYLVDGLK
ncbi:MAG: TolB family protein, partial [Deltaproteobacteria bacterium]